ncbi:MAG: tetratricopeptide repeat protein [Opitutales bacterium]
MFARTLSSFSRLSFLVLGGIVALVSLPVSAFAQNGQGQGGAVPAAVRDDPATMPITLVQQRAQQFLVNGDFIGARPFLEQMVIRYADAESPDLLKALEAALFFSGVSYLQEYAQTSPEEIGEAAFDQLLKEAIDFFNRYEQRFPNGEQLGPLLVYRADAYRGLGQWAEAATDLEKLLSNSILANSVTAQQREDSLKKITQSYYVLKEWDKGLPWFQRFLNVARDEDDQASAATALMEAYIAKNDFDKAFETFAFLTGDSPARYSLQFNLALMEAGDKLSQQGDYNQAALIFNLVVTMEEIEAFLEGYTQRLDGELNRLQLTSNNPDAINEVQTDLFNAQARLEQVRKAIAEEQTYSVPLKVRMANVFQQTNRDYEGFFAYKRLTDEHPDHENIGDFIISMFTTASRIGFDAQIEALGEQYLNDPRLAEYRDILYFRLGQLYADTGKVDRYLELAETYILEAYEVPVPNELNEPVGSLYRAQMVFTMGKLLTDSDQHDRLQLIFEPLFERYQDSFIGDGFLYWMGLSQLFQREYAQAEATFEQLRTLYTGREDQEDSIYSIDAYYRQGVAEYVQDTPENDKLGEAIDTLTTWVETYPDHNLRGEVEFYLGLGKGLKRREDEAIEHFLNVEKYTENLPFIQSAYQEAGKLLEENRRFQEMAELFERFLGNPNYRLDAEPSEEIFQLARAYDFLNQPDKMAETLVDGLSNFGDDPRAYGMDKLVKAFPRMYNENLNRLQSNVDLLRKLKEDQALRKRLTGSEANVYAYFIGKESLIDRGLQQIFYARGEAFNAIQKGDLSPLEPFVERYEQQLADMTTKVQPPAETFQKLHAEAKREGNTTRQWRFLMMLDGLGENPEPDKTFDRDDLEWASPATLVWIGRRAAERDRDFATEALEYLETQYADSDEVFYGLLALGEILETRRLYLEAVAKYEEAEERFPIHDDVVEAVVRQAVALRADGDYATSFARLQRIINTPDWSGEPHARAFYEIGETYYDQRDYKLALGFYEQVILGYTFYSEWAARSYLRGAQAAGQLGQAAKRSELLQAAYDNEALRTTTVWDDIEQAYLQLQASR